MKNNDIFLIFCHLAFVPFFFLSSTSQTLPVNIATTITEMKTANQNQSNMDSIISYSSPKSQHRNSIILLPHSNGMNKTKPPDILFGWLVHIGVIGKRSWAISKKVKIIYFLFVIQPIDGMIVIEMARSKNKTRNYKSPQGVDLPKSTCQPCGFYFKVNL